MIPASFCAVFELPRGPALRFSSPFVKLIRAANFLRHVPPKQIGRRLWLEGKRRTLAGLRTAGPVPPPTDLQLGGDGLNRLLNPSAGTIEVKPDGYVFSFLGRSLAKAKMIDWRAPACGAADQLWRMNLHYMDYLSAVGDDVFVDLIEQWIAANRPYQHHCWHDAWNAYALSIRTTIWMEEFSRRHARLPPPFGGRLLASLAEQLRFLISNIETDVGGNHLVKNIRALATAARVLSGPLAERSRETALGLLWSALEGQVLVDGMHFELSPSYHNQVLSDLLAIRHAMAGNPSRAINDRLDTVLGAMAQVSADLAHPDGYVALFGDSGLHMAADVGVLLAACGRLSGNQPSARRNFALQQSGYFGFRDARTYLVIDCGRLGPDALMAHAHSDALSFELSVDGQRFIVDQGVLEYAAGQRRDASRAARTHNTVSIEGLDQADFFSAFRCGVRPNVEVVEHAELPAGLRLEGRHDGFTRTGRGPVHRRRFTLESGRLEIHDWLESIASAPVSSALLLHPACDVTEKDGSLLVTRGSARMRIDASVPFTLTPAVYWPDMGIEEKTKRILIRWPRGHSDVRTEIAIHSDPAGTHC